MTNEPRGEPRVNRDETDALTRGRFDVWLLEAGPRKILVIKTLRTLLGTGLKETLDRVNACPLVVLENVDAERADYAARELTGAGAAVQLVSRGDRRVLVDLRHPEGNAQQVERLLCQGELLIEERGPLGVAGRQRQQTTKTTPERPSRRGSPPPKPRVARSAPMTATP
jgi:hypothetical protein